MKQVFLNKLILSIDVGSSGSSLFKSTKLLKKISLQYPAFGMAKRTVKTFSIRRGEYISSFCSLSKKKGVLFLYKILKLKNFTINESNFSLTSTFGLGINDHLELGFNFDQKIGIYGLNIIGDLSRRGYRIKFKKRAKSKIGFRHRIFKKSSIEWYLSEYKQFFDLYNEENQFNYA
mmetsp:Transcript_27458/g.38299  ORF Transcript_27458/g.38299 Transcript_27458/m.38299 type:complete len:176 (+) Transcript_27458:32-559(+)